MNVKPAVAVLLLGLLGCEEAAPEATSVPATVPAATPSSATAEGHEHCAHHEALATATPLPGESVFHLTSPWTTQSGAAFELRALRGKPTVVLMFYGTCTSVCPLLIADVKGIEENLAPDLRAQTQFLLVTFDPERDTVDRLAALATEKTMDASRWRLLRGNDAAIRELAMVLGVQYRRNPDGTFSHSNTISLLDPDGVLAHQTTTVGVAPDEMIGRVARILHEVR